MKIATLNSNSEKGNLKIIKDLNSMQDFKIHVLKTVEHNVWNGKVGAEPQLA